MHSTLPGRRCVYISNVLCSFFKLRRSLQLSREDMQTIVDAAAADIQADPHNAAAQMRNGWMQYQFSMHVLGENML